MAQRHGTREQAEARKARIVELDRQGLGSDIIAIRLGISQSTVINVLRKVKKREAAAS